MRIRLAVYFVFISCFVFAQNGLTVNDIFEKTSQFYKKNNYLSYSLLYKNYKDINDKVPSSTFTGEMLRKNEVTYTKIKEVEMIGFDDYIIKISPKENLVFLEKNTSQTKVLAPIDISKFVNGFDAKLTTNATHYICELMPKKYSQIMIHKALIYINKTDYSIAKQVIYMLQQQPYKDKANKIITNAPRIEITINNRAKKETLDDVLTQKSNYYTIKNKKVILNAKYSKYKLINATK